MGTEIYALRRTEIKCGSPPPALASPDHLEVLSGRSFCNGIESDWSDIIEKGTPPSTFPLIGNIPALTQCLQPVTLAGTFEHVFEIYEHCILVRNE